MESFVGACMLVFAVSFFVAIIQFLTLPKVLRQMAEDMREIRDRLRPR